jgi:hypothetical protein
MIIVYQIRSMEHGTVPVEHVSCPLCGTKGGVQLQIRQKYVWWFGPMAPSAKYGIAQCTHCEQLIPNVKWTDELRTAFRLEKAKVKTPRRLWRGMKVLWAVVFLFVATMIIAGRTQRHSQQEKQAAFYAVARNPQRGDIFRATLSVDGGQPVLTYLLMTGDSSGDSLYMRTYSKPTADLKDAFSDNGPNLSNFSQELMVFSRRSLTRPDDNPFLRNLRDQSRSMVLMGIFRDGKLYNQY